VPGVIVVGSELDADMTGARLNAPGEEILVPVPGGGFDYASGSSLSAAQVSGIAALLVAMRPGLPREDIVALLRDSQEDAGATVNACRALSSLLQQAGCDADATVSQAH
jgi:subtilisin family serine protease